MCCFSCCSCFCCRFCGLLLLLALLLLLLLPVLLPLLLLLLLLCCCCCCGCFQVADRWKANLSPLLNFQKVFAAYFVVCAAVLLRFGTICAAVCTTCCCLCGLLFVLFLLLLLFFFFFFFFGFCLHCFAFSVVCPAFAAGFGSPTVEKPTLAAFDLPKCQEQFYN